MAIDTHAHFIPQAMLEDLRNRIGDFPNVEEQAKNILSLPIHQYLDSDEIEYVATLINKYFSHS